MFALWFVAGLPLRYAHSAGPWSVQSTLSASFMSFFNVLKYPPSLDYLLITLGPSLILLGLLDGAKGARGLMQLMAGTAREQAGKMGMGYDGDRLTSDPSYNVMLGSAYFQRLLNNWGGSVPLAVASYNAGSGNVRKWVDRYGDPRGQVDMLKWIEAIPFVETKAYVQRVIENSVVYDRLNPSIVPPQAVHLSYYLGKSRPG